MWMRKMSADHSPDAEVWPQFLADAQQRVDTGSTLEVRGTLTRLAGLVLEAAGVRSAVGSQCLVSMPGRPSVLVEVVGFSNDKAFLMPAGDVHGLRSGASVVPAPPFVSVPRLGDARRGGLRGLQPASPRSSGRATSFGRRPGSDSDSARAWIRWVRSRGKGHPSLRFGTASRGVSGRGLRCR